VHEWEVREILGVWSPFPWVMWRGKEEGCMSGGEGDPRFNKANSKLEMNVSKSK
jgi:hypothetical protein